MRPLIAISNSWVCEKCRSRWPASTTLEAFNNRRRAAEQHPNEECAPSGRA